MPAGRPSLYDPKHCDVVEAHGRNGKSQEQIAALLDVDPATLRNWAEAHPEFFLALTRAKVFEQAWWEDVGQEALFADKFNSAVWAKSVSSRFREKYTEKVVQEQTGANGEAIKHEHIHRVERVIVRSQD